MNIYVASSWRNNIQQSVVQLLRSNNHEVYDFRNPDPNDPSNKGFAWSDIDTDWKAWDPIDFRAGLQHPIAQKGFDLDMGALRRCDACVLVLPCNRSAHTEMGWACGAGKKTIVYYPVTIERQEPELMYKMFDKLCVSPEELLRALR